MRTQAEWNVDTHIFSGDRPDQLGDPWRISSAALLVKVMARIANGGTPCVDEVGDAVGEHPGLAGAGPGDDEQRPARVDDGVELVRVEQVQIERARVARGRAGWAGSWFVHSWMGCATRGSQGGGQGQPGAGRGEPGQEARGDVPCGRTCEAVL